jgi:hypothetical protein
MGSMSYFRKPAPRIQLNGFAVVVLLAAFDIALIAWVVVDAWRTFGPKP